TETSHLQSAAVKRALCRAAFRNPTVRDGAKKNCISTCQDNFCRHVTRRSIAPSLTVGFLQLVDVHWRRSGFDKTPRVDNDGSQKQLESAPCPGIDHLLLMHVPFAHQRVR